MYKLKMLAFGGSDSESSSASESSNARPRQKCMSGVASMARLRGTPAAKRAPMKKTAITAKPSVLAHQTLMIEFWRQRNYKLNDIAVRHFWTRVSGYKIELLDKMWDTVRDMMDIDD